MLRDLEHDRRSRDDGSVKWTPETLRTLLHDQLSGDEVIVVSNREPYIHVRTPSGVVVQRPASGLVTAIEPVMRACSGTWIAHGSGSADRERSDALGRLAVPPDAPEYTLRRVWLSRDEEQGYYYGFANEGLWPLCHIAHVRPVFRAADWAQYRAVNERFADAVVAEAHTDDPVVLVQDYHFALLPAMIRERLPRATVITFWHIPWPNPESFGICPWRDEILAGLLGSTILGFHTRYHCKNFIETVDRFLETRIEHEDSLIHYGGRRTLVEHYPISIHWPEPGEPEHDARAPIDACRKALRERLGAGPEHRVAVGVDRLDYTKGILERFLAVESLLDRHPEWVGRFTLVQIAAPSRSTLDEYREFELRARALAGRINQRFASAKVPPIELLVEHHDHASVTEHYRGADACVVTSLHDGMNLVAKEFIAARDDERGVLLLSQFAGAARELHEALLVNPYHVEQTADALHRALTMPAREQGERMRSLRSMVRDFNVYRWAARMLIDAARLRQRARIEARISDSRSDLRRVA
jgi:trehalose 6-phosphate synthase